MSSRYWADRLLAGWRSFLWLIPPTAYALYIAIFTMPVLFNGIYLSSFFNPHLGYIDDTAGVYHNYPFSFHNIFVLFALAGLYLIFSVRLCLKSAGTQSSSKQSI
ncbi:Protein SRT-31, partial [Aphelenchoides avenae]